jgi:peptide deformylase
MVGMSAPFGLQPTVEIVQAGDPVLRASAPAWDPSARREDLDALVELMRSTMLAAPGVGLAAPQIGLSLRLAVLQDLWPIDEETAAAKEREPLEFMVAVDPSYTPVGGRTATHFEGCLSVRGYTASVERPADILASWSDLDGVRHERELHGWQARIFQHETDHLNGTLYVDKAATRSLCTEQNYSRFWSYEPVSTVREGLGY